MRDYTQIKERLNKIDWFQNIGNQDTIFDGFEFCWLEKPEQLEKYATSIKWENVLDEFFYEYQYSIEENVPEEMQDAWNEELKFYKENVVQEMMPYVKSMMEIKKLPECIEVEVRTMIIHLFMGEYYKEYGTTPFFTTLLEIYEAGHIPCGYTGKIGSGKIVIY